MRDFPEAAASGFMTTTSLNIWLVRDYEPLPVDPGDRRLMRMGMLAQTLAARGHRTTWFTSTFDHQHRRQRSGADQAISAGENLTVQMFRAPGYRRTIGPARIWHNICFGRAFRAFAGASAERPDVVVADIPTTEAAREAARFACDRAIPLLVQVRDLWPDFFADFSPRPVRPLVRLASRPLDAQVGFACRNATSIVGISPEYLRWGQTKGGRISEWDRVFPLGYRAEPAGTADEDRAALERMGVAPGDRVVAFVGSWGASYDLENVLATARLLSDRPDIRLVIAGDREARPELAARLGALPNVRLPGWLSGGEIGALLRRAEIGLLPYVANAPQGLPNKAFEYLAYGAYQLSTIGGELAQLYEWTQAGAVVAEGGPSALSAAVRSVIDDPSIAARRGERLRIFSEHYDAAAIYAALADHIEMVAASRAGAGVRRNDEPAGSAVDTR